MNTSTEASKLINWRQLSKLLSGNEETVRSNKISKSYIEPVKEITAFINYWISKHGNK